MIYGQVSGQPRGVIRSWIVIGDAKGGLSRPLKAPGFILEGVTDLDGDGINEIVMGNTDGTHQGVTFANGFLVEIVGGRAVARALGDDFMTSDRCSTGIHVESDEMATVVFGTRAPNGAWRFRSRPYRRWCYRARTGEFAPL